MKGAAVKVVLLGVVVAVMGCATHGNPKVAQFNPSTQVEFGKTTKAEIKAMLGEPNAIKYGADGKESWAYVYGEAQAKPATFIPIVGLFAGGIDSSAKKLIFAFDDKGVLQKEGSGEAQIQGGSKRQTKQFLKED